MARPRKWMTFGPEARRLAATGLSVSAIAEQLGVDRSTVHRWRVAGQLEVTPGSRAAPALTWADAVRAVGERDATDEAIITLAAYALSVSENPHESASVRLTAAGRFQSLAKQLAARARPVVDVQPTAIATPPTARADPRAQLMPTIQ